MAEQGFVTNQNTRILLASTGQSNEAQFRVKTENKKPKSVPSKS